MNNLVKEYVLSNGTNGISFYDNMKKSNILTDDEIFADIASLLFPSIDTTSNTLGWCVIMLCKNIAMQELLYKELTKVYGSNNINDIDLSPEYLNKLVYFRAYIHEILRIFPTTYVSAVHFVTKTFKLPFLVDNKQYYLYKHSKFAINSVGIGRCKEHWINKNDNKQYNDMIKMDEINFDFWIQRDNNGKKVFKYNKNLTVFGLGKRDCIGKSIAIKNLYVILACLIMTYKFCIKNKNGDIIQNFDIKFEDKYLIYPKTINIDIQLR